MADGKVVAVARRSIVRPIFNGGSVDVYAGDKKLFSLAQNFLDCAPVFIYPFSDGKRFLCDVDDDTAMLDFVVDFGFSPINSPGLQTWPVDGYFRGCTLQQVTNIVFDTEGIVRWPTDAELNEVSAYLNGTTSAHAEAAYFDTSGLGTKEHLLLDLATNRQSAWPMGK